MFFPRHLNTIKRLLTTVTKNVAYPHEKFDHVFSFPSMGYFALLNRLKIYHVFGSCIILPSVGLMEFLSVMPEQSFFAGSYIGVTGGIVLSAVTYPFRNLIGHIYISEDNSLIKISSVDFYGRRIDRIIKAEEWIPLLEMQPKTSDAFYLSPQLTDGTKYKLLIKFGTIKNAKKMGQVLE
ncbi:transmembrane protein 186 [Pieris napi]|uniref:transmembrane protein 186 n=1 Tax=Pieris napi TaxID=78633 RepID=UPI001FB88CF2|nr:transmembrane protein 186 [Pieris napi]